MRAIIPACLAFLFLFVSFSFADPVPLEGLTLKEAYQLALKRSETVAISAEIIKETQGRFLQAFNGVLPQVSFVDKEVWQDARHDDNTNRHYTPQRQFTFTQPLFSGFKEFAAIAGSKAEKKQRQQELARAKQLLFTDVSDAFYLFKSYAEDVAALEDINKAFEARLVELNRRQKIGRSKPSEVASTMSKAYQNQAQIELVKSQRDVTRELLEFLVGAPVKSIKNEDIVIDALKPPADYLKNADNRPDVVAAREAKTVALKKVTIARAGNWPTVNAVGNSYLRRVGSASDVDWDITLNITVPLFNGTQTVGAIREAETLAREADLDLSKRKRTAVLEIQNAYTQLSADLRQRDADQKAFDAAKASYDWQVKDYQNNLVNNLDVLNSLEDLASTHREFIAVDNQTQRSFWALRVATGDINDDAL